MKNTKITKKELNAWVWSEKWRKMRFKFQVEFMDRVRAEGYTKDNKYIYKDGKPLYKIVRRYSARKINLEYKELKPALKEVKR